MKLTDTAEQFRAAMRDAGLCYAGPLVADDKLHRFKAAAEKEHGRNSWYVLHAGPPAAGAFGCWKRGLKETWCADCGLSERDQHMLREHLQAIERERKRAENQCLGRARKEAARLYDTASPPGSNPNPYLGSKGVKPYGDLRQRGALLVLPLRDSEGSLHNLQFISPEGTKRFLSGGRKQGCYYTLAEKPDTPLVIAEGYATAASIHEATGYATIAAMDCGNLLTVAKVLREKWPQREITLAADNDEWTDGNPGLTKATEAANTIRARLAVPRFNDTASKPTDFNDLAAREGLAAVTAQLTGAETPHETDDQAFERLAKLSQAEYDRCRNSESTRLGIRTSTLDLEIEARRQSPHAAGRDLQGFAVVLPSPEPWPTAVNGAEVLDAVARRFGHYVVLPPCAADALALWAAHTHCFEAFTHTPRLSLYSPDRRCGKSTLLDVLETLVPRPLETSNMSCAVLFRAVQAHKPTLLLDETDTYLNDALELRGLLNDGHKRGAKALRCEGENNTVRAFAAFAPAALAGIGALPGTLHDRSIAIRLTRAKPREVEARFDSRRTAQETELCRKLARWAADDFTHLEAADPKMPEGAYNRLADNWRPLVAIAQIAGGDWPRRAAEAFARLTTGEDLDAQSVGTLLLADIADVFRETRTDKLASTVLAAKLAEKEGRPWAELGRQQKPITPNQLASKLRRFQVTPRTIRSGNETAKGYALSDFTDAFERFLPVTGSSDRHIVTSPLNTMDSALSEPSHPESVLRPENAIPGRKNAGCDGVTVEKPGEPEMAEADLL